MKTCTIFTLLLCAQVFCVSSYGQSLPVGMPVAEEYFRRAQLLGEVDSSISFAIRPIEMRMLQGAATGSGRGLSPDLKSYHGISYGLLPLTWLQQVNTDHPYGWNDGGMIPARGYQALVSMGAYAKFGPLSVQLKPEYVYAANNKFRGFPEGHSDAAWAYYIGDHNLIDQPERFGDKAWSKTSWGQSNVRLTVGPVSAGFSNENLWWGPGVRNSLLMTNNAPGFKHVTLNTSRPIPTPIGSFEAQIIGGRLDASGYDAALPERNPTLSYPAKPEGWRYLAGINFNYQPRGVTGLFIGFGRTLQMYRNDMKGFNDFFPVFNALQKRNTGDNGEGEDNKTRDQLFSGYVRWVWKEANAEIYGEFGRADFAYDWRDFIVESSHASAYVLGFRKLVKLNSGNYIEAGIEITQLEQAQNSNRAVPSWYMNGKVLHGYTHVGQILGAGIGKGSNLQSLDVGWVNKEKLQRIGLLIERYLHDNDFHAVAIKDIRANWVDLSVTAYGEISYGRFVFNTKIAYVNSLNYQWYYRQTSPDQFWGPGVKTKNVHIQLATAYRF
ncbi:capsule assembly Wzi family protein [Hufsiella ginkgonis]|uniref:Capsule assembly Wzi family protein n=1 Tax=Hufsiella ginkgonis TaxID=2695274 RepID=A0A7K1Y300_9SPHI|nr:capsule assembly Wzi family protein [Hufsiella ginkgonis]MXV17399.1 hypothetical protein [Hufsiella ginkgonis]